ncbi:nucleotidyltransferase family protein [Chloroflexota bacterium]
MKCLIMAGGFGVRLYPLAIDKAKALLDYKGKPLMTYLIDKIPQDIDILVTTNKKFEADFLQWQRTVDRGVELCVEEAWTEEQKKGAVSALNYWIVNKNITRDLMVVAGDNYFGFDLTQFIAAYNGNNTLVAIHDLGNRRKASQFGVVQLDSYRIAKFEEKPANSKSSLIATACYILPPRVFPPLGQYCSKDRRDNLGSFISHLVEIDEVHGYLFSELWFDIGIRQRKAISANQKAKRDIFHA